MFLRQCYICSAKYFVARGNRKLRLNLSTFPENTLYFLCKYLKIDECQAKYLQLKHPVLNNISEEQIKTTIKTLNELGYSENILVSNPTLCGLLPVTLKFRHKVLQECGLETVTPVCFLTYMNLVKQKTIGQLRSKGYILNHVNVENRLASCMTRWPTSLTTSIYGDINSISLYSLRLKIIQRYLELVLDVSSDEFYRGVKIYPTIKHRPLEIINETLNILQTLIMMPSSKIKSNLYLIHADPENLKNLIHNFKSIGGIDIKEIIRLHPKLAMKNYLSMLEIRKLFKEFNVSNEAQIKCFEIYTLSPVTIRERFERAKKTPEFATYLNHPRFLKIIHYNKKATDRLMNLHGNNKKCVSLNILSSNFSNFETFEKAPGDRMGKGKDLLFCISGIFENAFTSNDIRNSLKKHPFWINIPLVQVKYVANQLLKTFSPKDLYENCSILLYPWNKISEMMYIINHNKMQQHLPHEHLDLKKLSNSQKLSLILYLLEKKHYFSGNGVWTEVKNRSSELTPQTSCISNSNVKVLSNYVLNKC